MTTALTDFDRYLFNEGTLYRAYETLGAHPRVVAGVSGVFFAVWAPNAERVSVVGDFNRWDGRVNPMRPAGSTGIWEVFVPGIGEGAIYKYEISPRGGGFFLKADPGAFWSEARPRTGSVVWDINKYQWQDQEWLAGRGQRHRMNEPMSVYEMHLGSWRRGPQNTFLNYREMAVQLADYVRQTGFTHVEILPVTEHPLDESWGYQTTGYFSPTSRFGTPDDFAFFVDHLHRSGIGVIMDWVPAHFPKDDYSLARFDGTALYEHSDPRQGEHRDWGTLIFNYGRHEVANFLTNSALFWLDKYHIDGLRLDAVASMLYLDYSREPGEWIPNRHGGRENLEAIEFLKQLNRVVYERHPDTFTVAEESTAWLMVSRPTDVGGLGFGYKWNMGWMNDTLAYQRLDPVHRKYHHQQLTFGLLYAFTENFVLPFSHDEVVHGKGSLLAKMPGDDWQKFANLRLLLGYLYAYPGKKLLFMGGEIGQWSEWECRSGLDWQLLQYQPHQGVQRLVSDLNGIYRREPALHQVDFEARGFEWIDFHDVAGSVIAFQRFAEDRQESIITVCNFTPVPRHGYQIGVSEPGLYRELLNSDSEYYGGGNLGNGSGVSAEPRPKNNRPYSLSLTLPPLAILLLKKAQS